MITKEYYGGTYPEPPEQEEKCFNFEGYAVVKLKGYVWCKDIESATKLIKKEKYDEVDMEIESIEYITKIEED